MAHEMSLMLTDEEYAKLSAAAELTGKPVELLAHDILIQRLQAAPGFARATNTSEFTARQYQGGKVPNAPPREALTPSEVAAREVRARLLAGRTPASDMVIEDRGSR